VKLTVDSQSNLIAVKTAKTPDWAELIWREGAMLETLKHPLVLELRGAVSETPDCKVSIATAYAGHGSLASQLPPSQFPLRGENRIAKIVAGIALAMRFVHSRRVVHRDLTPANILLDWDWTVRIADFGDSASPDAPDRPAIADNRRGWPSIDLRYTAPECDDGTFLPASDVFGFGLILFELLAGPAAFPKGGQQYRIASKIVEGERPDIPDFVLPGARALIEDCWKADPDDRPTFAAIVDRLREMEFKVTANVNSRKLAEFVRKVEEWESCHPEE
jgi:serine/threonine protein kinase